MTVSLLTTFATPLIRGARGTFSEIIGNSSADMITWILMWYCKHLPCKRSNFRIFWRGFGLYIQINLPNASGMVEARFSIFLLAVLSVQCRNPLPSLSPETIHLLSGKTRKRRNTQDPRFINVDARMTPFRQNVPRKVNEKTRVLPQRSSHCEQRSTFDTSP